MSLPFLTVKGFLIVLVFVTEIDVALFYPVVDVILYCYVKFKGV